MTVKTVILSSRDRVSGTGGDSYVEIRDRLIDNTKKYECRVKWLHLGTPTQEYLNIPQVIRNFYVVIDGLYLDDTYCSNSLIPFLILNTSTWGTNGADRLFEPQDHLRIVRVNQNILRVRFFDPDEYTYVGQYVNEWALELQFREIGE